MKRGTRLVILAATIIAILALPSVAFAPLVQVPLSAGFSTQDYNAYQDEQGYWWIDGSVSNNTGSGIPPWSAYSISPAKLCVVTVEYLNSSNVVVGSSVQPVLAYVLGDYDVPNGDYYSRVHVKQNPPPTADPAKTRLADSFSDQTKAYGQAWAYPPVRLQAIPTGSATVGVGGRTTYGLNVTNNNGYNVTDVIIVGTEVYWDPASPGMQWMLNTLYTKGPSFIADGDTVGVYQVTGHAATPAGKIRSASSTWAEGLKAPTVTIYRFFNKKNGSHFYTGSEEEKAWILATLGATYVLEGPAYTDDQSLPPNAAPLYRFYNKKTGTHFYTANHDEKMRVINTMSAIFNYEGIAYYVSTTENPSPSVKTVWRFFNKKNGSHFYTSDPSEKANVQTNMTGTFTYEGPAYWLQQ